jgi:hypothetical protein
MKRNIVKFFVFVEIDLSGNKFYECLMDCGSLLFSLANARQKDLERNRRMRTLKRRLFQTFSRVKNVFDALTNPFYALTNPFYALTNAFYALNAPIKTQPLMA